MRTRRQVHGDELLFLGVFVNHLDIIQNVAAIELIIVAANAYDGFGGRSEHPLGDIDLV